MGIVFGSSSQDDDPRVEEGGMVVSADQETATVESFVKRHVCKKSPRRRKVDVPVMFAGLQGAGKSSLVQAIISHAKVANSKSPSPHKHVSPRSTVGFDFHEIKHEHSESITFHLNVWDVGGDRRQRECWEFYYPDVEVIVFVVDSTRVCSKTGVYRDPEARRALHSLAKHHDAKNCSIIVLANKQDCEDSRSIDEISEGLNLSAFSGDAVPIIPVSAKTAHGADKVLEAVANARLLRRTKVALANAA
eukprot:TRINITY_DN604_c0_g1_i1.p1 TRINITY_DN604_c0_g1~~TRINITY_DN604_c0_g1_i1.p1  ORF type:complete len:248 (-),score=48.60 TRINITY_DN604_c0_g1_i1:45-788(-)